MNEAASGADTHIDTEDRVGLHRETPAREEKEHNTAPVPSISNSCPWLPSRVLDRKGAKSTKISLSKGATFSSARSSLVVMLWRERDREKDRRKDRKIKRCLYCVWTETGFFNMSYILQSTHPLKR